MERKRYERLAASVQVAATALETKVYGISFDRGGQTAAQVAYGMDRSLIRLAESGLYAYEVQEMSGFSACRGASYHLRVMVSGVQFWCGIPEADALRLMAAQRTQEPVAAGGDSPWAVTEEAE